MNEPPRKRRLLGVAGPADGDDRDPADLAGLLARVARGDQEAFEEVYAQLSGPVYGLVLRILRDAAQAEEVAQEVLVELWRTASRYEPSRGGAASWAMTLAHRRAVDRVRTAQAGKEREERAGAPETDYDQVSDQVGTRLEHQQVRHCLAGLTDVQRESITLAYYRGYSYREVAELLGVGLAAIKTRMRDGLIRLRDCMGVQ